MISQSVEQDLFLLLGRLNNQQSGSLSVGSRQWAVVRWQSFSLAVWQWAVGQHAMKAEGNVVLRGGQSFSRQQAVWQWVVWLSVGRAGFIPAVGEVK